MRKILLAGAAMLATTGLAMAVTTSGTSITVTTTVAKSCTVAFDDTSDLTLPADSNVTSAGKNITLTCNFTGSTADVTFDSLNNGVLDSGNLDLPGAQPYKIFYGHDGNAATQIGTSALPATASNVASIAGTKPGVFSAQLVSSINVAGNFSDTMSVSVVP